MKACLGDLIVPRPASTSFRDDSFRRGPRAGSLSEEQQETVDEEDRAGGGDQDRERPEEAIPGKGGDRRQSHRDLHQRDGRRVAMVAMREMFGFPRGALGLLLFPARFAGDLVLFLLVAGDVLIEARLGDAIERYERLFL